ncbi:MAG: F0F1 ATP synthase subunit epsilon [Methylovirgula sp.]|uniref:F0F1 ATP synthase subunit epsilon n=1 Tax=Methylovirgula sp. TaxID=1978224 RepID=UPI003076480B
MPAFPFELVSPEKIVFSGEVEAVVVPGVEGEFTVLKDHAPTLALIKPGILEYDLSTTQKTRLFVRGGFAQIAPEGLTILAEQTIALEELDAAKLDADLKDAEEDVADAKTDETRRLATERRDQINELKAALKL